MKLETVLLLLGTALALASEEETEAINAESLRSRRGMRIGDSNWYNRNEAAQMISMQAASRLRSDVAKKIELEELFDDAQYAERKHAYALRRSCIPILVQQHVWGTTSFFHKRWDQFKIGFSSSNGNYWIGNELLHQLTKNGRYKLRVDLQWKNNNAWSYAEYQSVSVSSEEMQYELHLSGYSGNAGDGLAYNSGAKFSTYDRDNDQSSSNCAQSLSGGFWYKSCTNTRLNTHNNGHLSWYYNKYLYPKTTRMWLLCR